MRLLPWLLLCCICQSTDGFRSFDYEEEEKDGVPALPRVTKKEKWAMIRESGQDPSTRRRKMKDKRASNGRTYLFSGDRVFQAWIEDGLPQKAAYYITEMFAGGPRTVTTASTNTRSGVTTLFSGRQSYRFRWNNEFKRFHIANNSPKTLNHNITLTPTTAFEWQGHQVLINGESFITYDAYWNIATFQENTTKYFPELPLDLVGLVLDRGPTIFLFTKRNTIQVYDRHKHRPVLEIPLRVNEMAGCYS